MMIELSFVSLDFVRAVIQNFTIIATLILLYHFIPDRLISRSKLTFSFSVGVIFGLAAALSIPALWQTTDAPVLGFNVILVPLAGYLGGPVSSVFVAAVLLLGSYASTGSLSPMDILTVMSGILLGALFYYCRSRSYLPRSLMVQLILLGTGIAIIEACAFTLAFFVQPLPESLSGTPPFLTILPYLILSIGGTVVLGSIILFIDRKKQAEKELLDYRDHLESLVEERTLELRQANSLQRATIESTADGIVVVDRDGIIRAYNQKASHILRLPRHLPTGPEGAGRFNGTISALFINPEEFLQRIAPLPEAAEQIVTSNLEFSGGRIYEVYVQPQRIGEHTVGRVFSFHDITEQRHAEDAIRTANNKLVLLGQIARHDILNQLSALSGYLELVREKSNGSSVLSNLDTMEKILEIIRLQLEFTRDYQDLGIQKPVWQNTKDALLKAAESFADHKIDYRCETGNLEIYADPLIERVFYNLIDNSVRHGGRITEIRLLSERAGPDLLLLYEDNGIGVPPEEKEKIFRKGFGKHTGLGMFLIKEILSITAITIRETGMYNQGARFEIRVPCGRFRFP